MWTLQNAEKNFSVAVDEVLAGRPQAVGSGGEVVVVVLSKDEYERLLTEGLEPPKSFADHLLSFPGCEIEREQFNPRDVTF